MSRKQKRSRTYVSSLLPQPTTGTRFLLLSQVFIYSLTPETRDNSKHHVDLTAISSIQVLVKFLKEKRQRTASRRTASAYLASLDLFLEYLDLGPSALRFFKRALQTQSSANREVTTKHHHVLASLR